MVYVINTRYKYLNDQDLIVPAPTSDPDRGYNQALLLAKYVSKEIGVECKDIISKVGSHAPRHSTRSRDTKSDFDRNYKCDEPLSDRKILLIDDTYVKGVTMRECFRVLKECDAKEVQGLVLGRNVDQTHREFIKE